MENTEVVSALRKTELFRDLNDTLLSALARKAVERKLRRGETLFVMGESANGLYVIASGSVRAYRTGHDGREQIIHIEQAGATIGELPMFDDQPYPSTVAAEEDSTVLFLDRESVRRLFYEKREIARAALRVLSRRLRKCAELAETLSLRAVGQRLAQWFLNEARTRGRKTAGGVEIEMPLSREQMAARVGSVREVVSRALARLDQEGLVRIEGHRLLIPALDKLAHYVGES